MTTLPADTKQIRYDYNNQAWVVNGHYVRCNHGEACMDCYGTLHEGETA